jgi:hypothetical protein
VHEFAELAAGAVRFDADWEAVGAPACVNSKEPFFKPLLNFKVRVETPFEF